MSLDLTGILIACPAYGETVSAKTMHALYALAQNFTAHGLRNSLTWMSAADIAEVRNIFLTDWYAGRQEFSHLLMVDSDMAFNVQLVADMLNFKKRVTGAIYARRQVPCTAVGKMLRTNDTLGDVVDGFLPVAGVGCGVFMIHRSAITLMMNKMPEIVDRRIDNHVAKDVLDRAGADYILRAFDPMILEDGRKLSEDLSFCERWRRCGGTVWANVNHLIGHIGPYDYCIRYADFLEQQAAKQVAA